jgi:hypothetical protein
MEDGMPIKPDQAARYPKDWKAISQRIRFERAKGRCECTGECGLHKDNPGPRRCTERHGEPAKWAKGKVILTVAHLDAPGGPCTCPDPCGNEHHLKAMCQRCHLRYDLPRHRASSAATRKAKNPQLELTAHPGH